MPPETVPEKKAPKWRKPLLLLFKIIVTILCFWYISQKIDFAEAFRALQAANWTFLFLAVVAYVASKIVSAFRLNIYFRNINLHLPAWQNIKLYWLGMFYNLFLPGSISGDALNNGVLAFNRSDDLTYAGVISGSSASRFRALVASRIRVSASSQISSASR